MSLLTLSLLLVGVVESKAEQHEVNDVTAAETLEAYSHLLYRLHGSSDKDQSLPALAQMARLRQGLSHDFPFETHQTDQAWATFQRSVLETGFASALVTDQMDASTTTLRDQIRRAAAIIHTETLCTYVLLTIIIGVILIKVMRVDHRNHVASVALNTDKNFSNSVLDSLQEGILASDAEGQLTLVNKAIRSFYSLEGVEIPPNRWSEYFTLYTSDGSEELEKSEHPLYRALKGEVINNKEILVLNGDTGARYCSVNSWPINDHVGRNIGALMVMHDVSERRRAEKEIVRLASIVECSSDAVVGANLDGIIVSLNAAAIRLFELEPSDVIGRYGSIMFDSTEGHSFTRAIKTILKKKTLEPVEILLSKKDGSEVIVSLRYSSIEDADGKVIGISATATDITKRKHAEAALYESQKQLAEAQRLAKMGSWEYHVEDKTITWSRQMYRLFDFDPECGTPSKADILGRYHPEDVDSVKDLNVRALKEGLKYEIDVRIYLLDGSLRHCQIIGEPVVDDNGKVVRIIGTAMDITERKIAEQIAKESTNALEYQKRALEEANLRLEALASSDGLTGLRNRRSLDLQLEYEFARSARYNISLSVILLDIDHFKTFNDSFGHQAGDEVLRTVADILKQGTRESDIVARYGGEEMCIVLPETSFADAGVMANRLRQAVLNFKWERRQVTVSVGVSTFLPNMQSAEELVLNADVALYISKSQGRNMVTMAKDPNALAAA